MAALTSPPPESRWGSRIEVGAEDSLTVIRVDAPGLARSAPAKRLLAGSVFFIAFALAIPAVVITVVTVQHRGMSDAVWGVVGSLFPSLVLLPLGFHFFRSSRRAASNRSTILLGDGIVEMNRTMPSGSTCRVTPDQFIGTMVSFQIHRSICWELLVMIGSPRGAPPVRIIHDGTSKPGLPKVFPKRTFQVANGRTMEELSWIGDQIHSALAAGAIPNDG